MKKYIIIVIDIILLVYIGLAVTKLNAFESFTNTCTKVDLQIADDNSYGFLDAKEISAIMDKKGINPLGKRMDRVSLRLIEETLQKTPFVKTAQCCKTTDGHVIISLTQRSPVIRIKGSDGSDYYLDENGGIMPNSKYVSDLIIVTGSFSRSFAQKYISILANVVMASDFWRNQIVQINVMRDKGIELIPRVGDHIVFMGYLPMSNSAEKRQEEVTDYVTTKLDRLEKFYRYGLSTVGWNKYERIDVQYSNQIICKKRPETGSGTGHSSATDDMTEAEFPELRDVLSTDPATASHTEKPAEKKTETTPAKPQEQPAAQPAKPQQKPDAKPSKLQAKPSKQPEKPVAKQDKKKQ